MVAAFSGWFRRRATYTNGRVPANVALLRNRAYDHCMPPRKTKTPRPLPVRFAPNTSATVERSALLQQCASLPSRGVVLLEAPGGFGKTALLVQLRKRMLAEGGSAVWVSLRPSDREIEQFAGSLIAGLKCAEPHPVPTIRAPDAIGLDRQARSFGESLAVVLGKCGQQIHIVLDDYHQAESPLCDALVRQLIEDLPENASLAIASRRVIQFSVSRALMEGRLQRFDKRHLQFSREETRSFYGSALTPAELQNVQAVTEGWPAALAMARACSSTWRGTGEGLGTHPEFERLMSDYCRTEVLADLEAATASLLVDTAVLEALEPDRCDAVREATDSATLLADLTSHHTLLETLPIGANTWRVPTLLRQTLLRRAFQQGTTRVAQANLRAALWHEQAGSIRETIAHYLAAHRPEAAAATLERAMPLRIAVSMGDEYADALLDLLPERHLLSSARLCLCRAYLIFKRGLMEEAELLFEDVRRRTNGFQSEKGTACGNALQLEALVLELVIELYRRSAVSLEYVRAAEERTVACGNGDHLLLSLGHIALGLMYELRGDLEAAAGHLIQADQLNVKDHGRFQALWNIHHHGSIALARGQLLDARYQLHAGLKIWRKDFKSYRSFGPLVDLFLAEIDYESGALAEAQTKVDQALHTAEHIEGWFQHFASAYETQMMVLLHLAGGLQAEAFLARTAAMRRVHGGLYRFLRVLRLRLELLRGDFEEAGEIVARDRLNELWGRADCHDHFGWREWDLLGMCLCRLAMHRQDSREAVTTVDRLEQVARFAGRSRTQVRALILRSSIDFTEGQHRSAYVHLLQALDLGIARGFWRTFLDEAALIQPILMALMDAGDLPLPRHVSSFANRLMQNLQSTEADVTDDRVLSDRERDVVRELTLGSSNKVIARKLGLSEPTVKFHLVNIFRKLHVRKRASAVAEAHRRGWVP